MRAGGVRYGRMPSAFSRASAFLYILKGCDPMSISRRALLAGSAGAGVLLSLAGPLGSAPLALADASSAPVTPADFATISARLIAYYVSKDWLDDGTNGRVEWTYQSQALGYLASLSSNGSWSDVNSAATTSAANGAAWSPYLALDRMQAMAVAYANPAGANYHSATLLTGVRNALTYWFQVSPTSVNWWEVQIGIQLRMERILLLVGSGPLGATLSPAMVSTLETSTSGTGENAVWFAQNVAFRGLLTGDATLLNSGLADIAAAIVINVGDGIQTDLSYHQHGAL